MKGSFLLLIGCIISFSLLSQNIHYKFAAPNAVHHEAEISITVNKLPAGPAFFRMSRSSPGRYATHEFGKNVYNVRAYDETGKAIKIEKADADVYKVLNHKGTVKVAYTLFGNHADGTYSSVDATGYHLNMPATFMWLKGMDNAPISIEFDLPNNNWKIATQLKPGKNANTFSAPGLQYFMDSPTKIGDLQIKEWKVANADGKQQTFRLALEADAQPALLENFAQKVEKIVEEAKAVFGEVPTYDYGTYTFIASINPYVKGDGMEHRNSTMISIPRNFDGSDNLLGVFSHEFFHCWNVERIRPKELEPFNFEKSNMTEGLWVAEGFTQYYGDLILARAGLMTENEFLQEMSGLINTKLNTPGAKNYTPIENSQRAVFVDAGVSIDKTNYPNMYSSYYTYGGAIALALDLDLRNEFKNITLDNYMRELWARYGKTEKPYSISDLQNALAAITNSKYATDFFKKHVYGHEPFNYKDKLAKANLQLGSVSEGKAWVGKANFTSNNSNELVLAQPTIKNTPLYNAGLDVGDVIVSINGTDVKRMSDVNETLNNHKPGDKVKVTYKHHGKIIETEMTLAEDPSLKLVQEDDRASKQEEAFKTNWLGSKISKRN